jgi:ubiquinone/menaquinone biosynthesis C-methylase UbiE
VFPIVMGIPDFRLLPDPWIGMVEDRDKAQRLVAGTRGASLEAMVRAYWAMTPGTPESLASRFVEHVMGAERRSREWLAAIGSSSRVDGPWLDVGTGTGDLAVVVAEQRARVVGIDIAMRWLVVAKRRAELAGVSADFVCCNAEHLPFPDAHFARVVSVGTIEHCIDASRALNESRRVLVAGGDARLRTVNRYTIMPEPHVGVWGVGYVPRQMADRYVQWRSGQRYEHHRPLSSRELRLGLRSAGFRDVRVDAAPMLPSEQARLGSLGWASAGYNRARGTPIARSALRMIAPLHEASGVAA